MNKKNLNQFSRNSRKYVMKLCYSYVRELRRLEDILEHDGNGMNLAVVYGRVLILRNHIERTFPDAVIIACKSSYADYRNDFDRYKRGNWVADQTNKKYGRNVKSWSKAKHYREMLGLQAIPY
jgi:hypothetical protein